MAKRSSSVAGAPIVGARAVIPGVYPIRTRRASPCSARAAITEARDRLLRSAATIPDEAARALFLKAPEHALTLDLARRWLGDPVLAAG
jgi:hypothetical protein